MVDLAEFEEGLTILTHNAKTTIVLGEMTESCVLAVGHVADIHSYGHNIVFCTE